MTDLTIRVVWVCFEFAQRKLFSEFEKMLLDKGWLVDNKASTWNKMVEPSILKRAQLERECSHNTITILKYD